MGFIDNIKSDFAQMRGVVEASSRGRFRVLHPAIFIKVIQFAASQHLSPRQVALAVGVGVFIGVTPLLGLHLLISIVVASSLRLNKLIVYLAANISNPFLLPILMYIDFQLGSLILNGSFETLSVDLIHKGVDVWFYQILLGSLVLGPILGFFFGLVSFFVLRRFERIGKTGLFSRHRAIRRVIGDAFKKYSRFFSGYVRGKLLLDPVYVDCLGLVPGPSSILDVGGGVGLFGIYHQLYYGENSTGSKLVLDWDDKRIHLGQTVAEENSWNIEYKKSDVFNQVPCGNYDCILLFDVLHYQDVNCQKLVLENLYQRLNPGGVLIIREMNADYKIRNFFTTFLEKISLKFSFTKASDIHPMSASNYLDLLRSFGLSVSSQSCVKLPFFSNYLIVGKKTLSSNS